MLPGLFATAKAEQARQKSHSTEVIDDSSNSCDESDAHSRSRSVEQRGGTQHISDEGSANANEDPTQPPRTAPTTRKKQKQKRSAKNGEDDGSISRCSACLVATSDEQEFCKHIPVLVCMQCRNDWDKYCRFWTIEEYCRRLAESPFLRKAIKDAGAKMRRSSAASTASSSQVHEKNCCNCCLPHPESAEVDTEYGIKITRCGYWLDDKDAKRNFSMPPSKLNIESTRFKTAQGGDTSGFIFKQPDGAAQLRKLEVFPRTTVRRSKRVLDGAFQIFEGEGEMAAEAMCQELPQQFKEFFEKGKGNDISVVQNKLQKRSPSTPQKPSGVERDELSMQPPPPPGRSTCSKSEKGAIVVSPPSKGEQMPVKSPSTDPAAVHGGQSTCSFLRTTADGAIVVLCLTLKAPNVLERREVVCVLPTKDGDDTDDSVSTAPSVASADMAKSTTKERAKQPSY